MTLGGRAASIRAKEHISIMVDGYFFQYSLYIEGVIHSAHRNDFFQASDFCQIQHGNRREERVWWWLYCRNFL